MLCVCLQVGGSFYAYKPSTQEIVEGFYFFSRFLSLGTIRYVGRLPIYTTLHGYVALPWLIDAIFERSSARLIKLLMVVCFLGFFYIQVFAAWG